MVSSSLPHASHMGESVILKLYRYLFSCECPVRSQMRSADCLLDVHLTTWRYELDGSESSMCWRRRYCGDRFHLAFARSFVCVLKACWIAAALLGMCPVISSGRSSIRDEWCGPFAASFASLSTASFPIIPSCPGVHRMVRSMSVCLVSSLIRICMVSTAHWPRPCRYQWHPIRTAWLSSPAEADIGMVVSVWIRCIACSDYMLRREATHTHLGSCS
jgi:hypothetical protein